MPSMLTTCQSEVLHAQLDSERSHLLSWCDTLTGHLFRLYLITGNTDFLATLSVVEHLRGEAETFGERDQTSLKILDELAEQLRRIVTTALKQTTLHSGAKAPLSVS